MRDLDVPAEDKWKIIGLLTQHVLGEARVRAEIQGAATNPYADLGPILTQLADREELPHLSAAVAEGVDRTSDEADVGFGIRVILDGAEEHLRRHRRP